MKLLRTSLVGVLVCLTAVTTQACNKRDVEGWWHWLSWSNLGHESCIVHFRNNRTLNTKVSSCNFFPYTQAGVQMVPYGFTGGSMTIKKDCQFSGTVDYATGFSANFAGYVDLQGHKTQATMSTNNPEADYIPLLMMKTTN